MAGLTLAQMQTMLDSLLRIVSQLENGQIVKDGDGRELTRANLSTTYDEIRKLNKDIRVEERRLAGGIQSHRMRVCG